MKIILQLILFITVTNFVNGQTDVYKLIRAQLDTIYTDDQSDRLKMNDIKKKYGMQSPEMKALWQQIELKDSINLVKVKQIIDNYGWPGPEEVGKKGSKTIFLVIQHADSLTQVTNLPLMREAVKQKKAAPEHLALLEDRVLIKQGKPQIYGSQVKTNAAGKNEFYPILDEKNVNARRASAGLEPLEKYARYFDIIYEIPKD